MNKLHLLVAATLVVLAGCAGSPAARTAQAAPAAGMQYCKKDRLATEGDSLVCNWAASASDACEAINLATVRKSAVASGPSNAGRCGNGQWLVSVTTK